MYCSYAWRRCTGPWKTDIRMWWIYY